MSTPTALRWWACDFGHSNPIEGEHRSATFLATCPQCPEFPTRAYRVELDVMEDNPKRIVPAPELAASEIPEGGLVGQLDIYGNEVGATPAQTHGG